MPKLELPFAEKEVEIDEEHIFSCGLYLMLHKPLKEASRENVHLLEYLHLIPLEKVGIPKYYPKLSRKLGDLKQHNLIYPVNNGVFTHIYSDTTGDRDFYVSVEPTFTMNLEPIMAGVERRLLDFTADFATVETDEERKQALLNAIDKICVVKNNGNSDNGNKTRSRNGFFKKFLGNNGNGLFSKKGNETIPVTQRQLEGIKYLIVRDKVGLGILEPLVHDTYIEDISCSGIGNIFIEHKIFKSLKTAITFSNYDELDEFVLRLAERIKKPVTLRNPIADATLPDGSRINIVYGRDVSRRGSNFTIRRFSETPLSILELIEFKTMDYIMAAYLSLVIGEGMNVFIAGETASGKTTTLNAVTTFIHPDAKIVSIEDTPELQVPQKNWIREVAKTEKEDSEDTQTTMLDLLKAALRQRPNAIIVGEIRGVEGNIAFQAMQCIADGYVLKANGSLVNIKELFEKSRLKYGSEIESDKEVVKINNDLSDYYIFSANEDGIIKKTRIKALYKMSKSELIEIETDDGLRLRVTENHKFICNLDGKRREIGAKEILDYRNKKDILIFKPQKIEIEASEKNLWDFIETCDRKPNVVKDNLFRELENTFRSRYPFYVKKIATEIGVNKEKIGGYFIRRSEVVSWNIYKYVMQFFGEKLPEEIKFRFKGARRDIVLKKELNDILYFLGVFFAKGRIRRGKVFLDISEKVAKRVKLPYEIKKDGNRYFISSSSLVWLVKDVFGLDSKNIPDKILKLENNQLRYFIAGMESCAENYTLKTGSPSFWYALGRLIGDDCLYVCYKDGKVIDYRWQIKNANEDEGIRWACDARKVIPNHAKRISTSKDEDSFRTRICGIDRVFIDYLIKKGFIEMPKPPSITTSRAVVKHVPFNRIPKEALGPYLAGWFDSDWTIRKSKNRAIEIRCALDTSRNKGETNGKVLAVEQLEFISYLVTEKILPAIMGIEIRYHPELKSQVDELEIQIRNRVGGEKIRINEYKKGKVGIGMRVEFRSNKKEFSEVFKWWKENIAPCMYRKDKIEAINELFKGNTEDRKLKLKDKTNKLLTVARKKAEKAPFIFRDREVRLDLLPEKDKEAILYLDSDSGNLTRIVNVKKSEEEETYDISMDCGKYYIGGKYNISFVFDTGHAVMSTFHAASVEKLIQRLAGNPINAPKANIDNLNVAVIQSAVRLPNEKIGRRVVSINEIIGYDSASDSFSFIEIFRWDPAKDEFEFVGNMNSYLLEQKIAFKRGIPPSKKRQIYATLQRRANILEKLHKRGITDFYELLKVLAKAQKEGIF